MNIVNVSVDNTGRGRVKFCMGSSYPLWLTTASRPPSQGAAEASGLWATCYRSESPCFSIQLIANSCGTIKGFVSSARFTGIRPSSYFTIGDTSIKFSFPRKLTDEFQRNTLRRVLVSPDWMGLQSRRRTRSFSRIPYPEMLYADDGDLTECFLNISRTGVLNIRTVSCENAENAVYSHPCAYAWIPAANN